MEMTPLELVRPVAMPRPSLLTELVELLELDRNAAERLARGRTRP